MTYMPLRTVTIDLGNLRGQIFSRTESSPLVVIDLCRKTLPTAYRTSGDALDKAVAEL